MTWKKYLFWEVVKVFFFFSLCFFLLYALMDYSIHMQQIAKAQEAHFGTILLYYLCQFVKRLDLIFPLSFLIATIKTLMTLNANSELVAFLAGGISKRTLLKPFFTLALFSSLAVLLSFQFAAPKAFRFIDAFENSTYKTASVDKRSKASVHTMHLENGERILYQWYKKEEGRLFDVYYFPTSREVWHCREMVDGEKVIGKSVDRFLRGENGEMEMRDSYETRTFDELKLDFSPPKKEGELFENLTITRLLRMVIKRPNPSVAAQLYFKLTMPWLSLILALALPPFCMTFSRKNTPFLVYALALFGFIAYFTLVDAATILATKNALPPFFALILVPGTCAALFGFRFWKKIA